MSSIAKNELVSVEKEAREIRITQLYKQTFTGLIGSVVVALAAIVVFWEMVPQWKLYLWGGASVLLNFARAFLIFKFKRRSPLATDIDTWGTLHVVGVTLSALLWSLPYLFLWPTEHSIYQFVWPVFILPLSAAVVSTYHTWTASYAPFVLLTASSLSIRFFIEGGFLFNVLGFVAVFFIIVLLRAGRLMSRASISSINIGIRNETLNKELKETLASIELLNKQLKDEISERKQTEKERVKLIRELRVALDEISALKGVIPICSHCKGIRDDKGSWSKLEKYITDHSQAEFSHGICPNCMDKYYSEIGEN